MSVMLASILKVSLVILAGLGASALLRRRSAAVRHWILATALLCAAALPPLETVLPSWSIALTNVGVPTGRTSFSPSAIGRTGADQIEFAIVSERAPIAPARQRTYVDLLIPAWLVGAGCSLLILAVGLARLTWLASHARPIQPGLWTRLAEQIGREYGLRRPVQLLESSHPSLLVTWGLVRPKIILPRAGRAWPESRVDIVLRHELAHIRRGDWVVQIVGELLRSAYWFNPLIWIACARLRQESERACDDEVLSGGVEGPEYATHLLELARTLNVDAAPRVPAPAVVRSSSFERRIRAMLDGHLIRTPTSRSARFLTIAALLTLTVVIAAAQSGPVTLSGTVVDPTGASVPDVTVALTNAESQARHEVKTNQNGYYEFVPLPAAAYVLEASFPGFTKFKEPISLAAQRVRRDVTMTLGSLEETITIRGASEVSFVSGLVPGRVETAAGGREAFQKALDECTPSVIGGRVRPPRKIKDVRPVYPEHLQQANVTGTVVLKAIIATDGTVREATVEKSVHPELDNSAVDAVRQWQFDGTLLNCRPVEVNMRVSLKFGP